MDSSKFQFHYIHLNSVESTNIYAHKLLQEENVSEGLVVTTDFQEKGKGQLTKKWASSKGKNLMMSVLFCPNVKVRYQFDWSKMVAISLVEALDSLAVQNVQIKWPNDILIDGEKIAGVLIENTLIGEVISNSIIGIGMNVNQINFPSFARKATSMKSLTGIKYDLTELRNLVLEKLKSNYLLFPQKAMQAKYLELLYGYGAPMHFKDSGGEFIGVILGVLPDGRLQLNKNGKLKDYDVKELVFLD